jgi:hypothetical protein
MRSPIRITVVAIVAALVLGIAIRSQTQAQGQTAASPEGARGTLIVATTVPQLGKPIGAHWTPTTYEAATTEAQKKMLENGKPATVTGEIVDVSCYLQLGKRGEAHVACGTKCLNNGQPIGLVDTTGALYILFAEEHHPRRDGTVDMKKVFIPLLSKTVSVSGMATEVRGYRALFVNAAEIGASALPDTAMKK